MYMILQSYTDALQAIPTEHLTNPKGITLLPSPGSLNPKGILVRPSPKPSNPLSYKITPHIPNTSLPKPPNPKYNSP